MTRLRPLLWSRGVHPRGKVEMVKRLRPLPQNREVHPRGGLENPFLGRRSSRRPSTRTSA